MVSGDEPDLGELSDDAIAGAWRVWQRVRGHRYSLDDVATAWEAAHEGRAIGAARALDLGCGIGSVTLMLAHALPEATLVGIEAQAISIELARRNVARNGLAERIVLVHGDMREVAPRLDARFDLVSGTPPYFDPAKSSPSTDAQRTHARIEMRGGVETYLAAAARVLAPGGRVVVCGDARRPDRVLSGAAAVELAPIARRDVVPREGKGPLFTIWTLARAGAVAASAIEERAPIVARTAEGARTEQAHALRRFFGLPVNEREAASPPTRERRAR